MSKPDFNDYVMGKILEVETDLTKLARRFIGTQHTAQKSAEKLHDLRLEIAKHRSAVEKQP